MTNRDIKSKRVERQVKLPTSKAVEIAWKSIRQRLHRSLVVTSGIILAMAFLMYIANQPKRPAGDSRRRMPTPPYAKLRSTTSSTYGLWLHSRLQVTAAHPATVRWPAAANLTPPQGDAG